jgi:hypothetical protein
MVMSRHQSAGETHNLMTVNESNTVETYSYKTKWKTQDQMAGRCTERYKNHEDKILDSTGEGQEEME